MSRRFIAFDLETAKALPERVGNIKAHRPLGISCAALLAVGAEPQFWHGRGVAGDPATRMSKSESAALVDEMLSLTASGATLVSWNGLGFDFDILAEESGRWDDCRALAKSHVDMMFHVFCELGYPVSLDNACQGMRLKGKSKEVAQHMAPVLWGQGHYDAVLKYLGQDVQATLDLALAAEERKSFAWHSRGGNAKSFPLKQGWLTVEQALKLPPPDVSWMDRPFSRTRFTSWLKG
jgi:hypothetical protein